MIMAVLEGIAMCFVLLIVCVVGIANGPAGMVFFYEKEVQDKAIELGLTTRETIKKRKRMEAFLNRCDMPLILLISPPPMKRGAWVPDDGLVEESKNLARQYEGLAKRRGIWFVDAGEWDIALAYDGVHYTEEGHARFAEGLASRLEVIL